MHLFEFNPEVDFKLLLAAFLSPLVLYVVQIFFGRKLPRQGDWLLTSGLFFTASVTVFMAIKALRAAYAGEEFQWQSVEHGQAFHWLFTGDVAQNIVAGILYDGLGAGMMAVVGVVSFCVHLFSIGYMHGDRRYHIFFANISLFTFAMLGLVLADNFLFLFIFWEIMGLMSYLLIGHFSQDPTHPRIRQATAAGTKAFLTTRVGDVCLLLGLIIFYQHFGTLRITELWELSQELVAAEGGWPTWMTVGGLFIFGGTVGKSAQFPLHIWLPDAMEGPTGVSCMIHAATMVAAGVFLLGRAYPLLSPEVLVVVAIVGSFTALFAATIGTTVNDIKGVLAYSTISQLGFMVAAVGLGGVTAGMFHMVTHGFFKGCLFLCAGSVILGCHHQQDMRYMGGLWKYMPVTFVCMLIATLAISGIPLFSGFYSKDMILLAGMEKAVGGSSLVAIVATVMLAVAALLTAFYMFRLIFMTFFGEYRGHEAPEAHGHDEHGEAHAHLPHESPKTVTIALGILATFALFGGHLWLTTPTPTGALGMDHDARPWFAQLNSVERMYEGVLPVPDHHLQTEHEAAPVAAYLSHLTPSISGHDAHTAHNLAFGTSLLVAGLGVFLAWCLYMWRREIPARIVAALGGFYRTVANKYYIDEAVKKTVIAGSMVLSRILTWIDAHIVDGLVNLVGRGGMRTGEVSGWADLRIVDGAVNGVAAVTQVFGAIARLFQTGRVQQYVTFAVAGGLLAAAWLILNP